MQKFKQLRIYYDNSSLSLQLTPTFALTFCNFVSKISIIESLIYLAKILNSGSLLLDSRFSMISRAEFFMIISKIKSSSEFV